MDIVFYDGWMPMIGMAMKTLVLYAYTVFLFRLAGKRTFATEAGFDLISNIAMGTIIASTILSSSVSLLEGITVLTTLVGLQWIVSFIISRNRRFQDIVVSPSKMLLKDGHFLLEHLRDERLSVEQVEQNIREDGHASGRSLAAIILESNGHISIIPAAESSQEILKSAEINDDDA